MRRRKGVPDMHLWKEVQKTVTPLHPSVGVEPAAPLPTPPEIPKPPAPPRPISQGTLASPIPQKPAVTPQVHPFDTQLDRSIRRGKKTPDRTLDLHGLTVDQAHGILLTFVKTAYLRHDRLLLIITGKGTRSQSGQFGALRRAVPMWLHSPNFSGMVHSMKNAPPHYGGEGALFVYLKSSRKSKPS